MGEGPDSGWTGWAPEWATGLSRLNRRRRRAYLGLFSESVGGGGDRPVTAHEVLVPLRDFALT